MNALISSPDGGGSLTAGGVLFGYRQCRHQPDHAFGCKRSSHQTGRRAALEQRGQPCSRTERCEAVEECLREKANADRDRTLEWSRFGPCAGPKSSKAMPPIKSRRTSVPIGAWPRQPAAWTSFGATGIRTRALAPAVSVSGKRDFAFNTTGHQGICRTLARHSQAVRFV
jgi:hypothetical protein